MRGTRQSVRSYRFIVPELPWPIELTIARSLYLAASLTFHHLSRALYCVHWGAGRGRRVWLCKGASEPRAIWRVRKCLNR